MQRVRIKLLLVIIGFTAICGIALNLGMLAYYGRDVDRTMTNIVHVQEPLMKDLHDLYAQGLQTGLATRNITLNPTDDTAKNNYAASTEQFKKALAQASALATGPMRAELDRLGPLWDEVHALRGQVQSLGVAGKTAEALALLNAKETPKWREIRDLLLTLAETQKAASRDAVQAMERSKAETWAWTISIALASLLFVAVLLVVVARRIVTPLGRIKAMAERVAEGDFSARLEGRFSGELKETAEAIERMIRNLERSLGFYQGVVAGMTSPFVVVDAEESLILTNSALLDLIEQDGRPEEHYGRNVAQFFYGETRRTVLRDAMEQDTPISQEVDLQGRKGTRKRIIIEASLLKNAITGQLMGALCVYSDLTELKNHESHVVEQNRLITDAAARAEEVSGGVAESARQLASQIDEVEGGATAQKERLAEASTSMEQMITTVADVARSASGAAHNSEDARRKAVAGEEIVRKAVQAISRVRDEARTLRENMGSLGERAEAIGRVIGVIDDIADQTNLLALNAAIEAARAGDAGRGFAVVADEVRKLAEKTMAATKEVGQAIGQVQQAARTNISTMEGAASAVEEATGLAERSGQALAEIVQMVDVAADQVKSIAAASEEQAAASEQIGRAVDEIDTISARIVEAMRQSSTAVAHLSGQAQNLRDAVEGMRSDGQAMAA